MKVTNLILTSPVMEDDAIWSYYLDEPCCCAECGKQLEQGLERGWVWLDDRLTDKDTMHLLCPDCKL